MPFKSKAQRRKFAELLVKGTLVLILAASGCGRSPRLASGPIDLTPSPTLVRFTQPVTSQGPTWELCFEFDVPGDSHGAGGIHATLLDGAGGRAELTGVTLDRRGESRVCQVGHVPQATYEAVELSADRPLTVHGLRGGSHS